MWSGFYGLLGQKITPVLLIGYMSKIDRLLIQAIHRGCYGIYLVA